MKVLLFLSAALIPQMAHAVNVQQYSRSNSLTFEMIEDARVEDSHVYSDFNWIFNVGASYVDQPLVVKNENLAMQTDTIIKGMGNLHAGAAWYPRAWLELGTVANFSYFKNSAGASITGFSDLDLRAKFRVYHENAQGFAIMPFLTLPSRGGDTEVIGQSGVLYGTDHVLSDNKLGLGVKLIYEKAFRHFQLAANLGYLANDGAFFLDRAGNRQLDLTRRISTGLGVYVPVSKAAGINLEYLRSWSAPFLNDRLNPTELHLGFSAAVTKSAHFFSGLNFGNLLAKNDGNDFRVLAGFKFTPSKRAPAGSEDAGPMKQVAVVGPPGCDGSFLRGTSSATVLFERGKSSLRPEQAQVLRALATRLRRAQGDITEIVIYGHSSSEQWIQASTEKNLSLSEARAKAVERILAEALPSGNTLLRAEWESDAQPLADTGLGLSGDRRVEILVKLKKEICR